MNKQEVLTLLESLGSKPLKSLGQNFLIDDQVVKKICEYSKINHSNEFIEIGPGLGSLTNYLNNEKNIKPKLIELDRSFANYWSEKKDYEVFNMDALKFDWKSLQKPTTLISNLPYQISSRLLVELFVVENSVEEMIFMFQKEVGFRLNATPEDKKNYGLISVLAQLKWSMETVCDVSRASFFPRPEIESRVLYFSVKDKKVDTPKDFVNHLKKLFSARRKKIKSSIKEDFKGDLEVLEKRPDALTPEEHLDLFKSIL